MNYLLFALAVYSGWATREYYLLHRKHLDLRDLLRSSSISSRETRLNEAYITTLRAYIGLALESGLEVPDELLTVFEREHDDFDRNLNLE